MEFQVGDGARKVLTLWIAGTGVLAAFLIGALAGLLTPWLLIGSGLVAAATVAVCFWYPTRFVRSFRGSCREEALRAEIGVLFKKELYIPLSSLRTVESWVTPLHRAFRCRTIGLRFAGGAAILPLLPAAEAGELARLLEQLESVS